MKLFLGIRILRGRDYVSLNQSTYINAILHKSMMFDYKPDKTPIIGKIEYEKLNSNEFYDAPCQNLLGSLMYAMICTRPHLSYAVNLLIRFMNKNNVTCWQYLKGILRYLKGTVNLKLIHRKNPDQNFDLFTGFVD